MTAQGIAARSDKTRSGLAEGKSPVAEGYAPNFIANILCGFILAAILLTPWVL